MQKNLKKGFTLIELLVVIAIIGILSSVVLVSLNSARQKARDASRKTNIQQITTALSLYSDAFNTNLPVAADAAGGCVITAGGTWEGWTLGTDIGCPVALVPTYIPRIPTDTIAGTYGYKNASTNTTFCAVAVMEASGAGQTLCNSTGCMATTTAAITSCGEM